MNGTSGFQDVRSTTSRSPTNRLLREQGYRSGKDAWELLHTHNRIALSIGTSTNQETVPDTVFSPTSNCAGWN